MKLIQPSGTLTQIFGVNPEVYKPLKGHMGIDYVQGFKKTINAVVDGHIYSTQNLFNPNTDKYRAVYQIVDDIDFSYEVSYGHIDTCLVNEGEFVKAGQPIATEGNWGLCFVGGVRVKPEEKPSGKGSHLHFQVRRCKKVKKQSRGKTYLRNSEGVFKKDDFIYEVVDYNNGFNGCIDPAQFYKKVFYIFEPLQFGQNSDQVRELQKMLNEEGLLNNEFLTGFYGDITSQAVLSWQIKHKVRPREELIKLKGRHFGPASLQKLKELY